MAESAPRSNSRIAAARGRAEKAKTIVLAAAVIAFFGAMAFERGAISHSSSQSPSTSSFESDDQDELFEDGGLAPGQGPPSTSTGTS
jgi:hypothetical protein